MPTQRIPAGVTSRRHAKLLLHSVRCSGGASVKDLRLRRVVPPASAPLDSSPDRAAAKSGSLDTTPPEAASAAADDRETKPMLPRSKLVRDPGSFGYRRLLPFLNEMAKNDNASANSKEFGRSHSGLVHESVDGTHGGADPVDSVELLVVKTGGGQEMKDCCDSAKEETVVVNGDDLASSKPWLTRCTRSKFVHHPSSFSYKRMLPFLMENEISSQEGGRVKFRRVLEEKQLTSDDNDVLASGRYHLTISKDYPEECPRAEVEGTVEEETLISDGNYVLNGGQLQSAVAEVSPLDGSTAEVQKVTQQVLALDGDPLSADKGELTSDGNDVLAGGQLQLAVSEDSPEESNVAEVERIVEEKATRSDENSVLDGSHLRPTVSEVSPQEAGTAQMQKVKAALTSDGDEANGLTSEKGEFLAKEQPQLCETKSPEAAEDRETTTMLPRSKLVRDPGSFGYRRLLPFLNEMAKNDNTIGKGVPSENTVTNSKESHSGLVDESVDGTHSGAHPVDSVESLVVKTGGDQEMEDCSDSVNKETKIVNGDLASSKPWFTRCTRSKFVHHLSSFSYKRMLPFLMENEISSQEGDRVKFRIVSEEKQLTSDENDVLANGHHPLAISKDSPEEYPRAEVERTVEEKISISDRNYVLNGGQLQSAVAEVSPLEGSTAEVQKVTQQVLASGGDPLSSDKGELTSDRNDVLSGGWRQLAVSENSMEERNVAEVERIVDEKATKSDGNSVLDGSHLQPTVSEVSPHEAGTAQMQKAKAAFTSDGDEASGLASDKVVFLAKEQPKLCDTEELLKDNSELAEVQQCQSSESGCSDVGFDSPTKAVMVDGGAEQHGALERQNSMTSLDGLLPDMGMICRPSDPHAIGTSLSADEMSGCVMHAESGSRKVGTLRPCGAPCKKFFPFNGAHCLEKRGLSSKKLSPRKGILKRHTRGCKGICMCLDCSIFRLRADRAFEFSRKQMQEADDIIGNLLMEVARLRRLTEKASGQQEQIQAACQRASRVEEVARERRWQMLMELNSHCKIPGPRVKFAQYVEENMSSAPRSSSRR